MRDQSEVSDSMCTSPLSPSQSCSGDIGADRPFFATVLEERLFCPGTASTRYQLVLASQRLTKLIDSRSTALMLGVPAQVAGCKNITLATPPRPDGSISPEIIYIAQLVGAKTVVRAGGAHAIAAMAYGTESVAKADKLYGPGNQFVTAAKMVSCPPFSPVHARARSLISDGHVRSRSRWTRVPRLRSMFPQDRPRFS